MIAKNGAIIVNSGRTDSRTVQLLVWWPDRPCLASPPPWVLYLHTDVLLMFMSIRLFRKYDQCWRIVSGSIGACSSRLPEHFLS